MNDQTNNTNSTFDLYAFILHSFQVNKYTDKLFLYVIIPMALLGTVFNLISFGIFCKKTFNKVNLFKYMRVYTFTSLIVSSSLIFSFYFSPFTFPGLVNAYSTYIYDCRVVPSYVTMFFFFYENTLEIFINLERALCFSTRFIRYKITSPYIICLILLFICVLINGPNYFLYDIVEVEVEEGKFMKNCIWSQFTWSTLGNILLMASFIIQGPIVLIMEISTNLMAFISYRRFLKRKALAKNENKRNESAQTKKDDKINKKLLYMTFYMSVFSVTIHLIAFSAQFIIFCFDLTDQLVAWFIFIGLCTIAFKNFLNIFFFYNYNTHFKNVFIACGRELIQENGSSINRVQ